jgi:protease-4
MGDVAASGGYYISMGCQKVFAEPGTLTGSIGVVGGKIVTGGLMEWAGVKTENLSRGKNATMFSSHSTFSDSERKSLTVLMQDIYDQFLDKTLQNRNAAGVKMKKEQLLKIAGGRIWTGRQAKENGLVDELGTLDDAIAEAKKMAKLEGEPELLILPEPSNFLDRFLEGKTDSKLAGPGAQILPLVNAVPELRGHLRMAEMFLRQRNEKIWLIAPCEMRVR